MDKVFAMLDEPNRLFFSCCNMLPSPQVVSEQIAHKNISEDSEIFEIVNLRIKKLNKIENVQDKPFTGAGFQEGGGRGIS
ncbi:hypothetical protein D3C76_476990 [compost metagenome]